MSIHPTAIIDPAARIGQGVRIGPYCVVGAGVTLADGVELKSHVVVEGNTSIGAGTCIWPFASIGSQPQDLKFHGEESKLEIGCRNMIREHVTMNPGTEHGGMITRVGDDCLFMMGSHVAHDCIVGNRCILANNATLAGHVVLGDHVIIGGLSGAHQFVRIGAHAIIGGMSGVEHDVIPYGLVKGERAGLAGLNLIGLERRGFDREQIKALRTAYRQLFGPDGTLEERVTEVAHSFADNEMVMEIIAFIRDRQSRALCAPKAAA